MKMLFSLFVCLFSANYLLANKIADTIIVVKDPRLDVLAEKQAQMNRRQTMMTSNGQYKGFRIQVISTTNRDEANKVKSDVLSRFTDQKGYIVIHSPYFKVRVGNFINREDAEKFRLQLDKYYPAGVYVVEDAIEYSMKGE